ncbi:restriction endonuclease subunit S [Streptomyces griseoaurantiacus]|uniref:restriction endonuclease subunit S n=1 Tax=Streptomyces griseoaurantiacus TaxID=68213 RepID=UPI003460A642
MSIHHGVVPRDTLTDDLPRAEDLSNYKLCEKGDIVLNRMRAFQGAIGISPVNGIVSPDYMVLRPHRTVEARYLHHLFRSRWFVGEMTARLRGIGGTENGSVRTPRINSEDLGDIYVSLPSVDEQRRIADFLDAETTRMDELRTSLQQFSASVQERTSIVVGTLLNANAMTPTDSLPSGWSWTPLAHLTDPLRQIMYGIVLPGPSVTNGVPIVKGGDVAANRLTVEALSRTSPEIESRYARSRLVGGDLVIAIRGSVGEIALVPDALTGANLTQDAARISVGHNTDTEWLQLVLQSPLVEAQIKRRVTGATIKGINIWDLKRIPVPTPTLAEQKGLARRAAEIITVHESLRKQAAAHQALLSERRQALITAAVTGQFDVSTASGRNVTEGVGV